MTYHVARARASAGRLLGSALVLCSMQALFFSALTLAVVPLALHRHDHETVVSGLIYSGYVGIAIFALALNGVLNGLHRYTAYNAARMSIAISLVAGQTVLLAIGHFSVQVIVTMMMGCYAACLLFDMWLVRRARPGRLHADRATARQIFAYGVRSSSSTAGSFLNQRLDQLVISIFLTEHQLGIYVVAITFTFFTPLIGGSIAVATLPNLARLEEPGERQLLARRLVSLTWIASAIVSIPIIALAPQLIELFFGSGFAVGGNITRVTAVASIAFATTRSLEAVLRGIGRPLAAGMAELAALSATVVGLATLVPTIGLIGAAWSSLLAYSVSAMWMARRIGKLIDLPVRKLLLPDRAGVAQAAARLRRRAPRPAEGS
jgi:O-antigen/teichoic acid export membrane protein